MTGRVAAVVLFAPLVFLLATSVPADVAKHRGETLRGIATVTAVESVRGGTMPTYAV